MSTAAAPTFVEGPSAAPAVAEAEREEQRRAVEEELGRLPEKYRAPVVLCYLQEKTHDQAARELGCPKSSLTSRLGRARELLHSRLTRRGLVVRELFPCRRSRSCSR